MLVSRRRRISSTSEDSRENEESTFGRDTWWRFYLRDTPNPGTYEVLDFIEEEKEKPATYNFKSVGRKRDTLSVRFGKGEALLPGAYNHQDLFERLKYNRHTYGFKNTSRCVSAAGASIVGTNDKTAELGPGCYETQKFDSIGTPRSTNKNWVFKSNVQRFPTLYFKPKEGVPPPGSYQSFRNKSLNSAESSRGTSCFVSSTPRFRSSNTKTPDPGFYEKTVQYPMPKTIFRMARVHGVFFPSSNHQLNPDYMKA